MVPPTICHACLDCESFASRTFTTPKIWTFTTQNSDIYQPQKPYICQEDIPVCEDTVQSTIKHEACMACRTNDLSARVTKKIAVWTFCFRWKPYIVERTWFQNLFRTFGKMRFSSLFFCWNSFYIACKSSWHSISVITAVTLCFYFRPKWKHLYSFQQWHFWGFEFW